MKWIIIAEKQKEISVKKKTKGKKMDKCERLIKNDVEKRRTSEVGRK